MNDNSQIIIIGAGQAATSAANSLRQNGFSGGIKIFGNENLAPYQRPPLSKAYMLGDTNVERLQFRSLEQWQGDNIEIFPNTEIVKINTKEKFISDIDGNFHNYDKLIIATGSRVRKLNIAGSTLENIFYLKTLKDSDAIKGHMVAGKKIAIIGAGYIGLEAAAIAKKFGLEVHVLELAPRVLARVASPELSEFFERLHTERGVHIHTNVQVAGFEGEDKLKAVLLGDGTRIECDLALVGIGILPNDELAKDAGLLCENGINTNSFAQTSDPDIYACGDCSNREMGDKRMRIESVHNAIEQGKIAAAHIMGAPMPKLESPWFWSDQYEIKLQIVGLWNDATQSIVRGDMAQNKFAIYHLDDENHVLAVDAINSPPDFLVGKQLVFNKTALAPEIISDIAIPAKEFLKNIN